MPFWVGLPSTTIDWTVRRRDRRDPDRGAQRRRGHRHDRAALADGPIVTVRMMPTAAPAANPAFDVTPARLVTGLITERGRCAASAAGLLSLYPERA